MTPPFPKAFDATHPSFCQMSAFPHVREVLTRATADIEPASFKAHLRGELGDVPLTPAALTVTSGHALDPSAPLDPLAERGVGVQLGYEGLRLTRDLIEGDAWSDADAGSGPDLDVLAAEVFVARGIHLLTGTDIVDQAIEIVRRFGRNRAHERSGAVNARERSLEADVISLAVNASAAEVLDTVPPSVDDYGTSLGSDLDTHPYPEPAVAVEGVAEAIAALPDGREPAIVDDGGNSAAVDSSASHD